MSDLEGFLRRWSRRKRDAAAPVADDATPDAAPDTAPDSVVAADADAAPAFDPASLPSLDSITADTDMRAFLAPGVPAELTRAALRRAWLADPQIRDFIGLAENQWDFTATDGMHGFGQLGVEEARRLVAEIMEGGGPPAAPADVAALPENAALPAPTVAVLPAAPAPNPPMASINQQANLIKDIASGSEVPTAHERLASDSQPPVMAGELPRRSHGRALPE